MGVDYVIVSKPAYIEFECPHCHEDVELPFENEYWECWVLVECPECGKMVELDEYKYD